MNKDHVIVVVVLHFIYIEYITLNSFLLDVLMFKVRDCEYELRIEDETI